MTLAAAAAFGMPRFPVKADKVSRGNVGLRI